MDHDDSTANSSAEVTLGGHISILIYSRAIVQCAGENRLSALYRQDMAHASQCAGKQFGDRD
jgi:hypothetical protein